MLIAAFLEGEAGRSYLFVCLKISKNCGYYIVNAGFCEYRAVVKKNMFPEVSVTLPHGISICYFRALLIYGEWHNNEQQIYLSL